MTNPKNNFILLADDDADDQELIRMAFSRVTDDYVFEIVNNGKEALESLSRHPKLPCLIILDLNMPMMDGIQTLDALSGNPKYKSIPKVILSTSDSDESKKKSLIHGAAAYFTKPLTMKELTMTAEKILPYCR